jgi:hypothetical protein
MVLSCTSYPFTEHSPSWYPPNIFRQERYLTGDLHFSAILGSSECATSLNLARARGLPCCFEISAAMVVLMAFSTSARSRPLRSSSSSKITSSFPTTLSKEHARSFRDRPIVTVHSMAQVHTDSHLHFFRILYNVRVCTFGTPSSCRRSNRTSIRSMNRSCAHGSCSLLVASLASSIGVSGRYEKAG